MNVECASTSFSSIKIKSIIDFSDLEIQLVFQETICLYVFAVSEISVLLMIYEVGYAIFIEHEINLVFEMCPNDYR